MYKLVLAEIMSLNITKAYTPLKWQKKALSKRNSTNAHTSARMIVVYNRGQFSL